MDGRYARESVVNSCWRLRPPRDTCDQYVWPQTQPVWDAYPEAAKVAVGGAQDIVASYVQERPDALLVTWEVASLEPDFGNVESDGGPVAGVRYRWMVSWNPPHAENESALAAALGQYSGHGPTPLEMS